MIRTGKPFLPRCRTHDRRRAERPTPGFGVLSTRAFYSDSSTHKAIGEASRFVEIIQRRQGLKVACIEEVAWHQGRITDEELLAQAKLPQKRGRANVSSDVRILSGRLTSCAERLLIVATDAIKMASQSCSTLIGALNYYPPCPASRRDNIDTVRFCLYRGCYRR